MQFQKHCRNIFGRCQKICLHSPKININFKKKNVPNVVCTQKKLRIFSKKSSPKVERLTTKPQNWKQKTFFGKKIPNCCCAHLFCCVQKSAEFVYPIIDKKAQVPRKKLTTKKNRNDVFHNLQVFLKTLLKSFLPKLKTLGSQSEKKLILWQKKHQNFFCAQIMKNLDFCCRNFDHSMEVFRSRYMTRKTLHLKKYTKLFLCTIILKSWDQCQFFWIKLRENVVRSTRKLTRKLKLFFCTPWMQFQKHCRNIFGRCQKVCLHSPKKKIYFWEKSYWTSSAHEKQKTEDFSGEVFLKDWRIYDQSTEMKKQTFLREENQNVVLQTYFDLSRKAPKFFAQSLIKKCSGSEKKIEKSKKKQERSPPHLEGTFENTVENLRAESQVFKLKIQKKINLREKMYQKNLCTQKSKYWELSWRSNPQRLKSWRSNDLNKGTYYLKKLPSYSLAHVLNTFEISAKYFFETARKTLSEFEKNDIFFEEKNQVQRFSAHLECTFKSTAETFLVDAKNFAITVQKQT